MPARDAPAASEVWHGVSHTMESRDFPESEGRLGLDSVVIQKERQQEKFALERKRKVADVALVWEGVRPTVRGTSIVAMKPEI